MRPCATVDEAMAVPFAVATILVAATPQGMVLPLAVPVALLRHLQVDMPILATLAVTCLPRIARCTPHPTSCTRIITI